MSEKNAAAFLRNDTRTIGVVFLSDPNINTKMYTYIAHNDLNLALDDIVVVPSQNTFALGRVKQIDEDLELDAKADIKYKWVVSKVDFTDYHAQAERNKQIEDTVRQSYRQNSRRSFQQAMLAGFPDDAREDLLKLLG